MTADPVLFLGDFLLVIPDEVGGALDGTFLIEVESAEHAEGRRPEDVNLKVLVIRIQDELALADGLSLQVP